MGPIRHRRGFVKAFISALFLASGLGACTIISGDGPDSAAIIGEDRPSDLEIYGIDPEINTIVAREYEPSLLRRLGENQKPVAPVLGPGDVINVTVWESVAGGLFAGGQGARSAALADIRIDQQGVAFIPYAGRLRLSGETVEGARRLIQSHLSKETLKPQVEVRLISDKTHKVTVTGAVGSPGIYQLDLADGSGRLIETLALAGATGGNPHQIKVKVVRGQRQGSINLGRLYAHPAAYDVSLLPGDKVIVSEDAKTFSSFGAVGTSSEHKFTKWNFMLLDALAAAGGLSDTRADRTGVFVFRFEHRNIVNELRQRTGQIAAEQTRVPIIYQLNLLEPESLFYAKTFQMQDQDTILVTNTPLHQWNKILTALSRVMFIIRSGISFTNFVGAQ